MLAGMSASSIIHSNQSAKDTSDISSLKQIGLAFELYAEQNDINAPLLVPLVNSSFLPDQIWLSKRDRTSEGYANWLAESHLSYMDRNHPYLSLTKKLSYVGVDAYRHETHKCLAESESSGWLARFPNLVQGSIGPAAGQKYLLLRLDTSVQALPPKAKKVDGGHEIDVLDLFCPKRS